MFIGKILFGLAAFVLTWHPVYAFGGILFGALFDLWIEKVLLPSNNESLWQQNFSLLVILLFAKFAKSDGKISKNEIQAFKDNVKMSKADGVIVGHYFNRARHDMAGIEAVMQDLLIHCRGKENIFPHLLEMMCKVAVADGKLYGEHAHFIRVATEIWKLPTSVYLRLEQLYLQDIKPQADQHEQKRTSQKKKASGRQKESAQQEKESNRQQQEEAPQTSSFGENPYDVLGIAKESTFEEAKKAYRQLVKDQHPDRMRGEDKSEQQIKAAENNLARINAAFKVIEDTNK